jgi:hypothetical protein
LQTIACQPPCPTDQFGLITRLAKRTSDFKDAPRTRIRERRQREITKLFLYHLYLQQAVVGPDER